MSWLWSWWSNTPAGTATAARAGSPELTERQLHALHDEWNKAKDRSRTEAGAILSKLVNENNDLRDRLAITQAELKDVRAGRKEEAAELKQAQERLRRLEGKQSQLAIGIFDLEEDFFSSRLLHGPNPAQAVVEAIMLKVAEAAHGSPGASSATPWTAFCFVFWNGNRGFVDRLLANGVFESVRDFEKFISRLRQLHPLLHLFTFDVSREGLRQKQADFTLAFARTASATKLVLGRWALNDRMFEALVSLEQPAQALADSKACFVEPLVGTLVSPSVRRLRPRFWSFEGVLRAGPFSSTDRNDRRPEINFNKPLWQQAPPLCLDYYLNDKRCFDERCAFSHAYRLQPQVLAGLRYEVARTACPLEASGHSCPDGLSCHFAHLCPRNLACDRKRCEFPDWMHTPPRSAMAPTPARAPAQPQPQPQPTKVAPGHSPRARTGQSTATSPLTKPAAAKVASFAVPGGVHELQPASPFAHPLSIASELRPSSKQSPRPSEFVKLTDLELAQMLEKARKEEREYERGLREDPFVGSGPAKSGLP